MEKDNLKVKSELRFNVPSDISISKTQTFKTKVSPKYYKQAYRIEWESMPDFEGWLKGVPGQPTRAYCTFCKKSLHAHRLSLLKHTCTIKHTKAAQQIYSLQDQQLQKETPVRQIALLEDYGSGSLSTKQKQNHKSHVSGDHASLSKPSPQSFLEMEIPTTPPEDEQGKEEEEEEDKRPDTDEMANEDSYEEGNLEVDDANQTPASEEAEEFHGPPKKKYSRPDAIQTQVVPCGPLSTHVLDTAKGIPISGLRVSLYKLVDGRWTLISEGQTNPDGRYNNFIQQADFIAGRYKLHFDVDRYFEIRKVDSLYPFIEIVFDVKSPSDNYHVPLLLSPFGYTTYRGS